MCLSQIHRDRIQNASAQGLGEEGNRELLMGVESQFHKMQRVLEMDCTTMNILTTSELYI